MGRGRLLLRLGRWLGRHLQPRPQVGAALLHLVAQFAAAKGGKGWIGKLPPGIPQPLPQGVDIGIEDLRLVHAGGISKRDRDMIRSDSLADAYSTAGQKAGKTGGLEARELQHHIIVG